MPRPGKGNVVSCMFSGTDADYYILVDGDDTYDPSIAVEILARLSDGYDLVNAARVPVGRDSFRLCGLLARYRARPAGSDSKLDKWQGGRKILGAVFGLMRHGRPRAFFSAAGAMLSTSEIALGVPIFSEGRRTRRVPRFPTAILATGLVTMAVHSVATGLTLDTVSRLRLEQRTLAFLGVEQRAASRLTVRLVPR